MIKKFFFTSLPASIALAFLAMVLFTSGGCGGDGGGGSAAGGGGGDGGGSVVTLTSLSINGPSSMSAYGTAAYTATATWSDNSSSMVTPTWGVNSFVASISPDGVLSCNQAIVHDEPATVTATYSSGGITKTASMDVTITNRTTDAVLTGLYINGPSTMIANSTATYTATAIWSNNSISMVTPTWSVNSSVASIGPDGVLTCNQAIVNDVIATVTASYSYEGITKTATIAVIITNKPKTVPFTAHMLTGAVLFKENVTTEGAYGSTLYIFGSDFSLGQYICERSPDTSNYKTGSWSIDGSGKLFLTITGQGTITMELIGDLIFVPLILVDDGTGTPYIVRFERCGPGPYPFYSSALPGTYVNQYGDTWVFNSYGTGSTTGDGGRSFTWSVDAGILKVVFDNGYRGWMYLRQSTRDSLTDYTVLKWAFVEYTAAGDFFSYHGGMALTRQ